MLGPPVEATQGCSRYDDEPPRGDTLPAGTVFDPCPLPMAGREPAEASPRVAGWIGLMSASSHQRQRAASLIEMSPADLDPSLTPLDADPARLHLSPSPNQLPLAIPIAGSTAPRARGALP
jgi:hypothetical protein